MRCEHCDHTAADYDALYAHVGKAHGLGAQAGMMSPELHNRLPKVAYITVTPLANDMGSQLFEKFEREVMRHLAKTFG